MEVICTKLEKILNGIEDAVEKLKKRQEFIIVLLFFALLVFGVVLGIGTLTSGYHLVDDHEILKWSWQMELEGKSIWNVLQDVLKRDMANRYRPAHVITRVFETKLFGINLTLFSLVKAVELWISCIFLYYIACRMNVKKIYAVAFVLVSLLGYQSATWWRLGTHEVQCILLFSVGFYCTQRWLTERKSTWAIISFLAYILMCNFKESFIVVMPFVMLYVLYVELRDIDKIKLENVISSVKNNLVYLCILGIIFIIPVLVVVFFIGANEYDMVGLDTAVPFADYIAGIGNSLQEDLKWYKRFGILFGLILLTYWDELKKLWKEMLLTAVLIFPQLILYGRTGLNERYMLPSTIGFSFFFICVIMKWKPLRAKRKLVYVCGILLLLAAHGRVALREADYFRYRGESITTMLEAVTEMSQGEAKILSCFNPNREGNLTIHYWMRNQEMNNVYYWFEEEQIINEHYSLTDEEKYCEHDFDEMDIVVMYNEEDRHWCYTPSLDLKDFTELPCGTLTIYVRENSGITLTDTEIKKLKINF